MHESHWLRGETKVSRAAPAIQFDPNWAPLQSDFIPNWAPLQSDIIPNWAPLQSDFSPNWAPLQSDIIPNWAPLQSDFSPNWASLQSDFSPNWARSSRTSVVRLPCAHTSPSSGRGRPGAGQPQFNSV